MAEVNSELKTTNDLLKEVLKNLGAINKETDKTPGKISKAVGGLKTIMGGGSRGNGTGGSSQMDHMEGKFGGQSDQSYRDYHSEAMRITARFSQTDRRLGVAQAGAQAVFGIAAGAAAMVPTIAEVSGQAGNYYGASLAAGGMSRQAINQATFSGLAGGITSTLGPSTSAAILAARGYTPGTAQYNATVAQIGGAARYMNMANESAAVAMSGMTQGNMASNLYAAGISSYNQGTGQMRSSQEIFGQLYERMTQGQSKMSTTDINNSIQAGILGQQTSALGMSEDQKQLFYQYFRDRMGGGAGAADIAGKGYGANPMGDKMRLTTSDTSVLNAYEKPMLEGFKNATDLIVNKVNPALESVADTAGKAAGFLGGLSESRAGAGLGVMFGGLMQAMQTLTMALLAGSMMGGKGPMGAIAGGAKMLLKGGAVAGAGYLAGNAIIGDSKQGSGQSKAGNAVKYAGMGAGIGMMIGMPMVGAAIGGLYGLASGGPNDTGTSGSFGGTTSITGGVSPATPIVGGQVGSGYREKGPMWSSRGHSGLDYPCPIGTPVVAALDGVVYDDNLGAAYGTYIQIDHGNGYQTIYGHLSEKMVSVGATVTKGQVIGKSGDTGHVTGPHLHYEVRKGKNNTVNPNELKGASGSGVADSLSTLIGGGSMEVTNSGVKVSDTASSKIYGSKSGSELATQALAGGLNIGLSTGTSKGTAASSVGNSLPANADSALVATLQAAGFTGSALATAYGIVRAESGGRPDAHNGNAGTGDNSYGLFQINMLGDMGPARREKFGLSSNEDLFDPLTNARVAYAISNQGTNFKPWTTYTSDKYKQFTSGGQGGPESLGVATPSMSGGTTNYSPQITINASFAGTSEAEAMKLVQIVRTELEKSAERRSSGSR